MKKTKSRVAAIQMASSPNVSANLIEAERRVTDAANDGAQLVVLPENFAFMGKKDRDQLAIAELAGEGPLQSFLSQLSKRLKIWLVAGTIPIKAQKDNKVRSACLVFNDSGEQVARYDKIHLFDVHLVESDENYQESAVIEPGDQIVSFDTPFGRVGLAICYDLRFPELFRSLTEQQIEIFCLPSAFTAITGKAHWKPLVQARAIENLSYVVAAAQGGFHKSGRETYGHSMIVDPWGSILAEAATGADHICANVDLEYLTSTRYAFPSLKHRLISCIHDK